MYVLFEFQSDVERFMAVRVLAYVALLYQDLIRQLGSRGIDRLPAILPIVLHSGSTRWRASEDLASLLRDAPPGLEQCRPQIRYLLIDECRFEDEDLAGRRNLAALLFRLEHCTDRERMIDLIDLLDERLQVEGDPGLRRAFAVWLRKVILTRLPDEQMSVPNNLLERRNMLAERVKIWEKELEQIGLEKGLERGRREGEAHLLTRQLNARFQELPESVQARLKTASTAQLESWAVRVLGAASLQEVFDGN